MRVKFQQWNLILYTDSLFTSFSIIGTYYFLSSETRFKKVLSILLLVFSVFLRPTGLGLLLGLLAVLVSDFYLDKRKSNLTKWSVTLACVLIFLIGLNKFLQYYIGFFLETYSSGEIIYPGIPYLIDSPEHFVFPDKHQWPIIQLIEVFYINSGYLFKATSLKASMFLLHIKPYYSWPHNGFILGYLLPVYFFAVKGVTKMASIKSTVFLLSFVLFQLLAVSFTSENWDGRFLLPVLPIVFVLAGIGVRLPRRGFYNRK